MLEEQRNEAEIRGEPVRDAGATRTVDQAVEYINACAVHSGVPLAQEVGDYVLAAFFHGDYEEFANPRRSRPVGFRALMARKDLLISGSKLSTFVRISRQLRELPEALARALSVGQHRALLPLTDGERKKELARQAVDAGWTRERLEQEVRVWLPGCHPGRRPLPPMVEAVRDMIRTLEELARVTLSPEQLERMGSDGLDELAEKVDEVLERLVDLRESLVEIQTSLEQGLESALSGSPN